MLVCKHALAVQMRFHESILGVYFDDLDMFGILHNARYLLFMERCIGEFWKKLGWGGFDGREDHDQFHLVKLNHLEYLEPFGGIGDLRVRMRIERLGRTSLTFAVQMMQLDSDESYATGKRVVVCIDPETRRPVPWSDSFREKLAPYT